VAAVYHRIRARLDERIIRVIHRQKRIAPARRSPENGIGGYVALKPLDLAWRIVGNDGIRVDRVRGAIVSGEGPAAARAGDRQTTGQHCDAHV
jgi:hypothetical protein